ncbi:hypothetical protein DPEC_G00173170 [Dallia pectoralis]|uniref:Uncharacterized protein n=1 Tax=Dallia pectoralis TaxID=75939 RepID=A0ACC2GDJ0_DALPE|nr:hypothetical protein DPEC_G00173170 [Dallia pectoralis]
MLVKLVLVFLLMGYYQSSPDAFSGDDGEQRDPLVEELLLGDVSFNLPSQPSNHSQILPKSSRPSLSRSHLPHGSSNYLRLPESVAIAASEDQTDHFKPERNARPLPHWIQNILLATVPPITAAPTRRQWIDIMCHIDRISVRIRKRVFTNPKAWKYIKLKKCPVNQVVTDAEHYKFDFYLNGCGMELESTPDRVYYSTVLKYEPKATSGIVRELPFSVPLECSYNRFHRSYKVGFLPRLRGRTLFRALEAKVGGVTITPHDSSWNELPAGATYPLGRPMFFEVKVSSGSRDQAVYVNSCFMTAVPDASGTPKYTVIDNYGCMLDGIKTDQSKFLSRPSRTSLRFTVGAFIFQEMVRLRHNRNVKKLYMHCEITMGNVRPTPSAKSCNYDTETDSWLELHGGSSLCSCCDGQCPYPQSAQRNMLTSHSFSMGGSAYDD